MTVLPRPPAYWRFVLCDLAGNYVTVITQLMQNVQLVYTLNRPATLSFDVPADSPLINNGQLTCGNTIVKAFRKSGNSPVEQPGGWQIKYVGRAWSLQDTGDGNVVRTAVTCMDPLQHLAKRLARDGTGPPGSFKVSVTYALQAGNLIIKSLVDRTNAVQASDIDTSGSWATTADQAITMTPGSYILPQIIKLCDTGLIDLVVTYQDLTTGVHANLGAVSSLGSAQPAVIFGYDAPPNTGDSYDRSQTMDDFANYVAGWGGNTASTSAFYDEADAGSKTAYGLFEDASVFADIKNVEMVENLVHESLVFRAVPKDLVTILPIPGLSARPFDEWFLGDQIQVNVGRPAVHGQTNTNRTRMTFYGGQRVYSFTLDIDQTAGLEKVSALSLSPQG